MTKSSSIRIVCATTAKLRVCDRTINKYRYLRVAPILIDAMFRNQQPRGYHVLHHSKLTNN